MKADPRLGGLCQAYTEYAERSPDFVGRVELPNPGGVLIFNLGEDTELVGGDGHAIRRRAGEGFVAGAHLNTARSRSTGKHRGIRIHLSPLGLRMALGVPATLLTDRATPLEDISASLGRLGERLASAASQQERIGLLNKTLIERFDLGRPIDRRQRYALSLLRHRPDSSISDIAGAVNWSTKHLAFQIRDMVGVGPRTYRRLMRFSKLTTLIPIWTESLAALALDAGYFDQSHMIREFREFVSMTPSSYMFRIHPIAGVIVERP